MGFLDKAKEKAKELSDQAKEKIDDVKDKRKADDLLEELGRTVYRQRTGRGADTDEAAVTTAVAALQALEAEGVDVLGLKPAAPSGETLPPPAPPAGGDPLPPPPMPS